MPVETNIYNNKFFKNTIKYEANSAAEFVGVVLKYYNPKSIVDIGCGVGIYLEEFNKKGIEDLLGVDGSPAAQDEFLLRPEKLIIFDLAKKYKFEEKYNFALCLEVAEHLREEDADVLVETIIDSANDIIFSAAVPGQGPRSIGHINEQPPEYWIKKFADRKYDYLKELT
jgi:2-polyprenyl-3-methyl-5-hydroxy-6-metoxy-1,4-benzoquinol methylase